MHAPHKLVEQLQRVADQAGATSAAVYLPTPWEPTARALLLQVGPAPALAELASQEAAEAFSAEVAETGQWAGHPAQADGILTSQSGDGVLIPVPLLTSLWAGAVTPGTSSPRRRQSDGRGPSSTAGWVGLRLATAGRGPPRGAGRSRQRPARALDRLDGREPLRVAHRSRSPASRAATSCTGPCASISTAPAAAGCRARWCSSIRSDWSGSTPSTDAGPATPWYARSCRRCSRCCAAPTC